MGLLANPMSGNGGRQNDWLCILRYGLYGALLGGFVGNIIVPQGELSVALGAVVGALLLICIKLLIVSPTK